jgi:hypothetical protein
MESNSEANRINMSEASALLLRKQAPEMPTISRGKINIKGTHTSSHQPTAYWSLTA